MNKLLTFAEAKLAGEVMFDRWAIQSDGQPPLERTDGAWADLARVAWDAVHNERSPPLTSLSALGFPDYGYTPDFRVVRATPARGTKVGRVVKPSISDDGYVVWNLTSASGRQAPLRRSVMVCTHHHGPRPEGLLALHNDGDPQNDSQGNLRWGTMAENMSDMVRHGRAGRTRGMRHGSRTKPESVLRGAAHGMAKLAAEQVQAIRSSAQSGPELSRRYGITVGRVNQIKRGEGWMS